MTTAIKTLCLLALAALLGELASGCAARRAYEYRSKQVEAFTFPMPAEQVLEGVRQVLFEKGFAAEPDGQNRLHTDWRYTHRETTAQGREEPNDDSALMRKTTIHENFMRYRYLIQARAQADGRTGLRVTQDEERSFDGSLTRWPFRDLDFEWEVLKRLMPKEAARIEAEAKAAAEKG